MLSIPWMSILGTFGFRHTPEDDASRPQESAPAGPFSAADRAQVEAINERLSGMLAGRILAPSDDEDARAEIDAVLSAGTVLQYLRPMLAIIAKSENFDALLEHAAAPPDTSSLSSDAAVLVHEGWHLQVHMFSALRHVVDVMAKDEAFDAFLVEHRRDPMAFLHEMPVEVAELALAAERGRIAGMALSARKLAWFDVPASRDVMLALMFRDGARADARFFASIWPDAIPLEVVPADERLDLERIMAKAGQANAFAHALFIKAEASDADVFDPFSDA